VITVGELFAGIGGIGLGLEMTGGFEVKWQVERDPYATRVLEKNWPDVKRWDDVTTFPPTESDVWNVDLIAGGFPCQDISFAGKGAGLKGERSGLFYEVVRIAERLRPRYLLLENVAALVVRGMGHVLGALAQVGYDCEWHCIPAAALGAPHRRDRVFILAYAAGERIQGLRATGQQVISPHVSPSLSLRESSGSRQHFWKVEPELGRVVNGVSIGVDRAKRIKALGNAVVPQVAQFIGEQILRVHNGPDVTNQR